MNNNFRITVTRITDIELKNITHYSHANPEKVWFHHLEITFIDSEGNRNVVDVHSYDGTPIEIHSTKFEEARTVVA